MTFPRLYALSEYWNQHPPVHLMVAAYLGYKAPGKEPPSSGAMIDDLFSAGLVMEKKNG